MTAQRSYVGPNSIGAVSGPPALSVETALGQRLLAETCAVGRAFEAEGRRVQAALVASDSSHQRR